jgi:hypothetical protein
MGGWGPGTPPCSAPRSRRSAASASTAARCPVLQLVLQDLGTDCTFWGSKLRDIGLFGFRVYVCWGCLGFRIQDLGPKVESLGLRGWVYFFEGLESRVEGSMLRIWD